MLASTRRLYRSIQREDIGLLRQFAHDIDTRCDVSYRLDARSTILCKGVKDHLTMPHNRLGLLRKLRVVVDACRNLLNSIGDTFHSLRLFIGCAMDRVNGLIECRGRILNC